MGIRSLPCCTRLLHSGGFRHVTVLHSVAGAWRTLLVFCRPVHTSRALPRIQQRATWGDARCHAAQERIFFKSVLGKVACADQLLTLFIAPTCTIVVPVGDAQTVS